MDLTRSVLDCLVKRAQAGDRPALEELVRAIQDPVHHLAVRMLVDPGEALMATEAILVRIVGELSTFSSDRPFIIWVLAVASAYLLSAPSGLAREQGITFEVFEDRLLAALDDDNVAGPEDALALSELRIVCSMALLLCLDRLHRLAYVLGDVLETDDREAAEIMGVSLSSYRDCLSTARERVVLATCRNCGVVNPDAPCSCPKRLAQAERSGQVDRSAYAFATRGAPSYADVLEQTKGTEQFLGVMINQRAVGPLLSPKDFAANLAEPARK
ncbi:MAG: hypothetical protein AAFR65_09130 [Pseudomonadota bacterium]